MERDEITHKHLHPNSYISTHTLTWSVTLHSRSLRPCRQISTHTLTWSVTLNDFMRSFWVYNFNSHAHVERDCFFALAFLYFFISTHTLTWSVTMPFPKQHINNSISTHTLTWSVTCNSVVTQRVDAEFQLTRSRGAWHISGVCG